MEISYLVNHSLFHNTKKSQLGSLPALFADGEANAVKNVIMSTFIQTVFRDNRLSEASRSSL